MDLNKAIKSRHSVRTFKETKKANWRDIIKAIDAANYAPLAGNISTIKFVLVSDKNKIQQLVKASQQPFLQTSSYVVVVCTDNTQIKRAYGEKAEKYSRQQAGAAIENFLLEIVNLGLASCWVGAFDDEEVKRALSIPDNIEIEALLPVGIELGKSKERKSPELDNVLYFDKWKNKYMNPPMTKEPGYS